MSPRSSSLVISLIVMLVAVVARADEVAAYLEEHGLTELLVVHLEQRLEDAEGDERDELLVRLAELYAQLLGEVTDPDRRVMLEQRGRQLLTKAPNDRAAALRFALLRASYRAAEETAEEHRLRRAKPDELDRARQTLDEIIPDLQFLRRQLEEDIDLGQRRLNRASGSDAIMFSEDLERVRQLHARTTFITAWALYYQSWLNGRRDNAYEAERLFIELLEFGDATPAPRNVSVDLRATEAITRCILGMGLCKSLTSSSATAIGWIDLLTHERAHESLRQEAPIWRIVVYLQHDEFLAAERELGSYATRDEVPVPWLRLVAVHALEAQVRSGNTSTLATRAVTELASRGELAQVFDLADRYGVEALGATGFAAQYVQGVLLYYDARERHGSDEPTGNQELVTLYDECIAQLSAAQRQPDARQYPDVLPDCARLKAWCYYFQGAYEQAQPAFEIASRELTGVQAAEALWMAIVSLDRRIDQINVRGPLEDQLAQLIDQFLAQFPSSEHAPKLVLRRAVTTDEATPEMADRLLAIPETSEVYESARRRAAQILYRLYRQAPRDERTVYANRYLSVAVPVFARERERLPRLDAVGRERFLVRGRRILEVALDERISRLVAAREVIRTFMEMEAADELDLTSIAAELDYRRLQERLHTGDPIRAARLADQLLQIDPEGLFARLAAREMFQHAYARWRDVSAGDDDRQLVDWIARYGALTLEVYADDLDALQRPTVQAYHAAVASALMRIWERSGDQPRGRRALEIYERLLGVLPRNARFLRAAALLSEQFDKPQQAVECWRTLVAGLPERSDDWFEAKYHLIRSLAAIDRERAHAVMQQHQQLNPQYGPEPWGERLRALHEQLRRERDTSPAGSGDAS
jgi:hypothetical protein